MQFMFNIKIVIMSTKYSFFNPPKKKVGVQFIFETKNKQVQCCSYVINVFNNIFLKKKKTMITNAVYV